MNKVISIAKKLSKESNITKYYIKSIFPYVSFDFTSQKEIIYIKQNLKSIIIHLHVC